MFIAFSSPRKIGLIIITSVFGLAIMASADEGMWLFSAPPLKRLKEKYHFEPTPQWLEHLQKASVRFNSGGSGSFVSANGLCITNHHVGADALQKASSEQNNYLKNGFYSKTNAEEIRCADLELNVLISTEDVTSQVNGAVKPGMNADRASAARGNTISQIEKESKEKTGLRSDVITLYQGGAYHLYRYKRYDGYLAGLLDPQIWSLLQGREQQLRAAVASDPKLRSTTEAYDRIKNAQSEIAKSAPLYNYLEMERPKTTTYREPRAFVSNLFKYARLLVRAVDERAKPNGERIPEFRDSARESLELELFSTEPIYDDYEILRLTDSLTDFASQFGANDPLVQKVLAGKSPHSRAVELVSGTKLKNVAVRKDLYGKDAAALQAFHDPMIDLARLVDGPARDARKRYDAQEEIKKQAYAEIAKARFAIEGTGTFPDATFTLRLSYGTVRGYEQDGKQIPAFTDFAGLYQRSVEHNNKPPFDLPQRWIDKKGNLNLSTHFDFVSDADIIGGNSGSPVINKDNEFVGIIFDGNIQSLVLDCIFTA